MTLAELTAEEERLMAEVEHAVGTMEEKHAALAASGTFNAYARVHAAYAGLAVRGDAEALKRALFLQWYADSEPSCFSGLLEVDPAASREVLERLDGLAASGALDGELRWMLPYYHAVTEWHFSAREGVLSLKRWLREHADDAIAPEQFWDPALAGRGQMSAYWYRPGYVLPVAV